MHVIADAQVALLEALHSGKSDEPVYLRASVRNRMRNLLKERKTESRRAVTVSLSEPFNANDPETSTYEDVIPSRGMSPEEAVVLTLQVERLSKKLTNLECQVVDMHLDGISARGAAKILNIDKGRTTRAWNHALELAEKVAA